MSREPWTNVLLERYRKSAADLLRDHLAAVRAAYEGQTLPALLYGGELQRDLADRLARYADDYASGLGCLAQGLEAEMALARDVLPPDWEMARFRDYLARFEDAVKR